jgi:hypothetical protein
LPDSGLRFALLLKLLYQPVGRYLGATNSLAKLGCNSSMAMQAKRADVVKIALPAALGYRQNVIRVPKALAGPRVKSPMPQQGPPGRAARSLQLALFCDGVNRTVGTHSPIAVQYLLAQVAWLRTQLPLVHAVI